MTTTTTTTTTTAHDCWEFGHSSTFSKSDVMKCEDLGSSTGGLASMPCQESGVTASREQCKELCDRTLRCMGFSYVTQDHKCYLTEDTNSDEECDGTEAWRSQCPYTTT